MSILDVAKKCMPAPVRRSFGRSVLPCIPARFLFAPLPSDIIVEPTNICNLSCPLCPTSQSMTRPKGVMKLDDFKRLVDEVKSHAKRIYFNFAGEPFLNQNLCVLSRIKFPA